MKNDYKTPSRQLELWSDKGMICHTMVDNSSTAAAEVAHRFMLNQRNFWEQQLRKSLTIKEIR